MPYALPVALNRKPKRPPLGSGTATADRLAAPPTARASHRARRPASHPPAARSDRTPSPGRSRRRRAVHRCLPPATRHRPPRDYDDAAATLALHDRARYTDGCAAYPVPPWAVIFLRATAASPGLSPARTRNCSPRQVTAGTCCAWRRRPGCARHSHRGPPQRPGRPSGVGLARTAGSREVRNDAGQARQALATLNTLTCSLGRAGPSDRDGPIRESSDGYQSLAAIRRGGVARERAEPEGAAP